MQTLYPFSKHLIFDIEVILISNTKVFSQTMSVSSFFFDIRLFINTAAAAPTNILPLFNLFFEFSLVFANLFVLKSQPKDL